MANTDEHINIYNVPGTVSAAPDRYAEQSGKREVRDLQRDRPVLHRVAVPHWVGKTVLRGHYIVNHIEVPEWMDKSDGPPGS